MAKQTLWLSGGKRRESGRDSEKRMEGGRDIEVTGVTGGMEKQRGRERERN